jgi:pilus assembly protein CpaE
MDTRENADASSRGLSSGEALSVVGICLDAEAARELRELIDATPFLRLQAELKRYVTEDDPLLDSTQEPAPDICLIDFDHDRHSAVLTAERIHERLPSTAVFAVSSNAQPDLIIQAMRCGCTEYALKPAYRDQLLEAVARVWGRKRERREQLNGEVLTFLGAKGGSGVTTVATHLGTLLAKSCSRKVLLLDLHPSFGDAALYLGLTKHQYHFFELAENVDRLDTDLLQSFVLRHPSGLDVLPAPDVSQPIPHVSSEAIEQTVDFIRLRYEFVLIDCAPGLVEQNLEMIRRSDQLYLVTVPEVSALRNVVRYLDYLAHIEFSRERTHVVLNRHVKRSAITDDEIEKAIRQKIYRKVPNQYNQVIRTIHGGDPSSQLATSEVARNLLAWAGALGGKPERDEEKKKLGKGFLGLLAARGIPALQTER